MQNSKTIHKKLQYFYSAIFGYFHWINFPQNVFISHENFHKDKYGNFHAQMCGKKFYLPQKIAIYIFFSKILNK